MSKIIDPIKVRWAPAVWFHGRSGTAQCSGVELYYHERQPPGSTIIDLQPFTSRDKLGNCHIEVPLDFVPQVIKALGKLYLKAKPKVPRRSRNG